MSDFDTGTHKEMQMVVVGARYMHLKTCNLYTVIGVGSMKHPTTREWVTCIHYQPVEGPMGNYVREAQDFMRKFVRRR